MSSHELISGIENSLPLLAGIFIAVFLLIVLIRILLPFFLNRAYQHYQNLKKVSKEKLFPDKKKFLKEEEELMRIKAGLPRAHSEVKAELQAMKGQQNQTQGYEVMMSEEQELDREEMGKVTIVDIVKPVGFWTSMILGQKLTYLIQSAQVLNKRGDKGFWASMIEAKEREAGREHSRSR